jgi:hypothetical protein
MNPLARARRWMQPLHALVLAALLLAAQGLGLAHHVVHGHGGASAHATVWLDGHGDGSADCRLIDQLGHADLAFGTPATPPGAPVGAAAHAGCIAPPWGRTPSLAYRARAPPQAEAARA